MDFLSELPRATLAVAGHATSFAADVFFGRPSFEEIQGFQGIMDKIGLEVEVSAQRKACQLASVDLIIDGVGLLGIFVFKGKQSTGNAKRALETLLQALPEAQQQAVQGTMRPFDYLDMLRVGKMQTVGDLRPYEEESSGEESSEPEGFATQQFLDEEYFNLWCRGRKKLTREEVLAIEFEEEVPRRNLLDGVTLAITNMAVRVEAKQSQALRVRQALQHWVEMAQGRAAVTVLHIGAAELCYQHCVHEARREALVQLDLCGSPAFLDVVRRSIALVEVGALPCPKTHAVAKALFFKRCSQVLQSVNPAANCNQRTLHSRERREIAILMGFAPKCDRCPAKTAECCFEWDKTFRRWTQYEINRSFGYTAAMTLPEDELTLCRQCAHGCSFACHDCRRSDKIDDAGDCQCGGRVGRSAPPGRPPTLLHTMQGFMLRLRGMRASPEECDPAAEAAEVAYEQASKRRRIRVKGPCSSSSRRTSTAGS